MTAPNIEDNGRDGTLIVNGCVTIDLASDAGAWADALEWRALSNDCYKSCVSIERDPEYVTRPLRVLVACEFSATVRDAFRARGFDAWSVDLLPSEGDPRWHIEGDALNAAYTQHWDLLICHPPCTDLAVSGARHFPAKVADGRQARALEFVQCLLDAPVHHIALENPVSIISSRIRKPDCTFQPWQHGHGEVKRTCLWLKNLPPLLPSNIVSGREERVHRMPPGPNRWKERSRTFPGVARAMAQQFGDYLLNLERKAA